MESLKHSLQNFLEDINIFSTTRVVLSIAGSIFQLHFIVSTTLHCVTCHKSVLFFFSETNFALFFLVIPGPVFVKVEAIHYSSAELFWYSPDKDNSCCHNITYIISIKSEWFGEEISEVRIIVFRLFDHAFDFGSYKCSSRYVTTGVSIILQSNTI